MNKQSKTCVHPSSPASY